MQLRPTLQWCFKASNNWLGEFYRRIKARSGAPIAIKATARKLAVIVYHMLIDKVPFKPLDIKQYNNNFKERKIKYLNKVALNYGLKLVDV